MLAPMAEHLKGRAIVAVCDISDNPTLARRAQATPGTMVIYLQGREVARSDGESRELFKQEMSALGLGIPGA